MVPEAPSGSGTAPATWSPGRALPFVGRGAPLDALVSAVEAAELGEPVLALVAGEPGVGKTRLLREVAARVTPEVRWAACWEGDGAPAFWPWTQLLRALPIATEADGEPAPTGAAAEVEVLLGGRPAADSSPEARFRLFDAVAESLARAARRRPLVLVVEDLHWADEASLRLLDFVARDRRPRRLALLGTYRDSDLHPAHPLARHLAELVRTGLHLSLGGLGEGEVRALVEAARGGGTDAADVVPLLHRRSGGNPFFLAELLALLADERGRDLDRDPAWALPGNVRTVVIRRIGALPSPTREVLAAASVAGDEVDVPVLAAATGRPAADVLTVLEPAATAGLVERAGVGAAYRFVHALVREVLYDALPAPERAALHRAVGAAVERRYGDDRVVDLAHHVLRSTVDGDDPRAVALAVRAAERSYGLLAYEEAAAWYERALDALRADGPDGVDSGVETDLLLRRGEAHLAAGDLPSARDAYRAAAAVARSRNNPERLAEAALGHGGGLGGFEVQLFDPAQVELLEAALVALDESPSRLRALLLSRLSVALSYVDEEDRRRELSDAAVAMARAVGDPATLGYALAGHCDAIAGPDHTETRLAEATEAVRLARAVGDRRLELLGRRLRLVALLELGETAAADAEVERFGLVAALLRQPLYQWYVPLWRGMRALMRGELDEAARWRAEAEQTGALAHSDNAVALVFTQWWVEQRCLGRFAEAGAAMAELLGSDLSAPPVTTGPRAVMAVQLGDDAKARVLLDQWLAVGRSERPRDAEWLPESAQLAEAAVLVGATSVAQVLFDQLRPYARRCCVEGIGAAVTGSVAWYLAMLARSLGRTGEAAAYEEQARAVHRRIGLVGDPPPLARAGSAPGGPAARRAAPVPDPSLVWEGATWAAAFRGTTRRLRDSKGLRDLAVLLARPGAEVHCLELVGGVDVGSAGPVIDDAARRAYQARIRDLQEDVEEARGANDPVRAERAELELDLLVQQLAEAYGLSGRERRSGGAAERARSAVSWRVRAALRHVTEEHPELGRHLQNSVRTGAWCSYQPEVPLVWTVQPPAAR